jgi:hypothetical protein
MRWAHLPVAGGLYDQDPELIRRFMVIFEARWAEEERQKRREDAKLGRNQNVAGLRRR